MELEGTDAENHAERLQREGVDAIHTVASADSFNHDVTVQAVAALAEYLDPAVVVMPHSVNSLDYAQGRGESSQSSNRHRSDRHYAR